MGVRIYIIIGFHLIPLSKKKKKQQNHHISATLKVEYNE